MFLGLLYSAESILFSIFYSSLSQLGAMSRTPLSYLMASVRPRRHSESDGGYTRSERLDAPHDKPSKTRLQRRPTMEEGITLQEMLELDQSPPRPSLAMSRSATMDARIEPRTRPRLKLSTRLSSKDSAISAHSMHLPTTLTFINDRLHKYAHSSSSSKEGDSKVLYGTDSRVSHGFCMDNMEGLEAQLRRSQAELNELQQDTQSMLALKDREVEVAHYELSMAWQEVGRLVQREIATRGDLSRAQMELKAVKETLEESLKLSEARARSVAALGEGQRVLEMRNAELCLRLAQLQPQEVAGAEKGVGSRLSIVGAVECPGGEVN